MFSKAKNKNKSQNSTSELLEIGELEKAASRPTPTKQQRTSARMSNTSNRKPANRASGVPSLISGDVIIKGTIEAEGEVQFDGYLEGDIRAKGLVIGEGATVRGEVVSQRVKVAGTVEGAIRAGNVELASTSNVKGDILHSALSIENGARFDGNCRHSDDPTSETSPRKTAPTPKPAPTKSMNGSDIVTETAPVEEAPVAEPVAKAAAEEAPAPEAAPAKSSSFLSRGGKAELR